MKRRLLFIILFAIVLSGCNQQPERQITATTLPVWEFTHSLCDGTDITVSRLVTENVSCLHDYTVQVSQMRAVESAQTVICSGAGLEVFLEDVLAHNSCVIDASEGIALRCGHDHSHEHDSHSHEQDPHIWLSPNNAKQMCKTICAKLTALYPQHAQQFEQNLAALLQQLDDLQNYGETTLAELSCQNLVTFHDGFAYFAESFDLHILRAVEEESGSETSAKELTELISLIKDNNLPAIFTEINSSAAAAKIIAAETGVSVHALDMGISGNSYFEAMYHNIDTIKEALG